jgi:integrase
MTVSAAADRFLKGHGEIGQDGKYRGDSERGTWKKYRCGLRLLVSFCESAGIAALADLTPDALEDFRGTRNIGRVTWKVERQMLITFFGHCVRRKWIATNPAKELKAPHNLKPNEVVPYTLDEESRILAACDQIGGGKYNRSGARYEQLRARAMIMLLRHTALRVSDVCTLRKDGVSWDPEKAVWRVFLHTQKTGDPVFLPIPEPLKLALDALPLPRNSAHDCRYYFWNGQSSRRAVVGIAERTLSAVFKKSGVKGAHAHRYRHTLATRLLGQGATFEEVADILGNSPGVVRKHYGKWSKGRQNNIDRLMMAHFQTASVTNPVTNLSHEKTRPVN